MQESNFFSAKWKQVDYSVLQAETICGVKLRVARDVILRL